MVACCDLLDPRARTSLGNKIRKKEGGMNTECYISELTIYKCMFSVDLSDIGSPER